MKQCSISNIWHCLGAIIEPSASRMTLGTEVIYDNKWKIKDLRALRSDKIGFVLQAPYLIPFLNVTDNVALLPMLAGTSNKESRRQAVALLQALEVEHRAEAMPSQLSGREQQRVAITRGLVNRPPVILADEPTAPLDSERALAVIRILNEMAQKFGTAIIVVTHDEKIIPTFKRIYHIRDGVTYEEAGEGRDLSEEKSVRQPTGCTIKGMCGKPEETANLQDLHIFVLRGIAVYGEQLKELGQPDHSNDDFVLQSLFATITNASWADSRFISMILDGLVRRDKLKDAFMGAHKTKKSWDFDALIILTLSPSAR